LHQPAWRDDGVPADFDEIIDRMRGEL